MNTSSNSRKRSSKSSSNTKEKRELSSSKADKNRQRILECVISPESSKKKEVQTLQSLKQKMKITNEELKYRSERSRDVNVIEKHSKFFKCTKCQKSYRPVLNKHKKLDVHPMLGVLMCFDCRNYYGDGNFSMDSDGEDKYCRWCGEGGTLFACSKCICGFCDICIRRHFGNEYLKNVQRDDDWVCFFCNPKPLWQLRFISSLAEQAAKKNSEPFDKRKVFKNSKIGESSSDETESDLSTPPKIQNRTQEKRKNIIYTTSSDESDEDTAGNSRKKLRFSNNSDGDSLHGETESLSQEEKFRAIKNLENILKLTEYQMGLGLDWSKKKFNKLKTVDEKTPADKLRKECQKMKWFISVISSYLVGFCNSIDTIEKTLGDEETKTVDTSASCTNHLTYTSIIQFLGFVTNQVKTFSEKGITLQDLLQAELYEDANVLGFRKSSKSNSSHEKDPPDDAKHTEKENDDENVTVASSENKSNEDNCEVNSKEEDSSQEIGDYEASKDDLEEPTSKSDTKESQEEISETFEDLSSKEDLTATEKNSPDINQFKQDWQSSINGEDVQDILTILESA